MISSRARVLRLLSYAILHRRQPTRHHFLPASGQGREPLLNHPTDEKRPLDRIPAQAPVMSGMPFAQVLHDW